MTMSLHTGTPGSGKSYDAVRQVLDALRADKWVIANFGINFTRRQLKHGLDKRFTYVPNEDLTIEVLVMHGLDNGYLLGRKESQCLVVIDEAGGRYPANMPKLDKKKRISLGKEVVKDNIEEWQEFFSQHGKLNFDFILVTQAPRLIYRQILSFVEYNFTFRKVNRFGPFKWLPFTVFCKVEQWFQIKQRVGSEFFLYNKAVARQYDRWKIFSGFHLSERLMTLIQNGLAARPGTVDKNDIRSIFVPLDGAGELPEGSGDDGTMASDSIRAS